MPSDKRTQRASIVALAGVVVLVSAAGGVWLALRSPHRQGVGAGDAAASSADAGRAPRAATAGDDGDSDDDDSALVDEPTVPSGARPTLSPSEHAAGQEQAISRMRAHLARLEEQEKELDAAGRTEDAAKRRLAIARLRKQLEDRESTLDGGDDRFAP